MVSNAYYNEIIQLFMRNWMPFSLFPYISLEFSDYSLQGDYSKNYCYRTHERYRLKFRNYIKFPENVHFHHQPSSHFCVRVVSGGPHFASLLHANCLSKATIGHDLYRIDNEEWIGIVCYKRKHEWMPIVLITRAKYPLDFMLSTTTRAYLG